MFAINIVRMVDASFGWFDVGRFDVALFDYQYDKSRLKQICITSNISNSIDIISGITSAITINSTIKKEC